MDDSSYWLDRVAHIRAWRRNGERAPHKPLLLLYALGRLQNGGQNTAMAFANEEKSLRSLLDEYGPPRRTSPAYPFHHLTSDGLWVVRTTAGTGSPGTNLGDLRSSGAAGKLDPQFARALLADPVLLIRVARALLEANFPPTMHEDIAGTVGLDLDDPNLDWIVDLSTRRRRSPAFRAEVLMAYEGRCAMCGWDGQLAGDPVGVEAAHVRWFNIDGPDALDNGVCLCSLHHKLLDTGAVGITAEHTIVVSARFIGRGPIAEQLVSALLGRELLEPQIGLAGLADAYIGWHTAQVFRAPARQVA